MADTQAFSPDWVSPPGDTIADILETRGWERASLAERTGFTRKHVNELIHGRAVISPDTAQRLATVLGSTVEFWLTREAYYRAALQKREMDAALEADSPWLRELPLAWMIKRGWIKKAATKSGQVAECLRFFGVASVDAWRQTCANPLAAFRSSRRDSKCLGAVAAWLRKAELQAASAECVAFDIERLRGCAASRGT